MAKPAAEEKIRLENIRKPGDAELEILGEVYKDFYKWRSRRDGNFDQFQGYSFDDYIETSRELFWNNLNAPSEDLAELGINVAIPYARKEILDFMGKMTSLGIKPRLDGDKLNNFSIRILNGLYSKWRTHSNQKVEKFWQLLYAKMNGTMIAYVGYNDAKFTARYMREYDKKTHEFKIEEDDKYLWDDVWEELRPIEDLYFPKLEERDIQKQGKMIDRNQKNWKEFKAEFNMFENAKYVYPGNRLAEDSLYFQLLSASGVMTTDRVEVLRYWDVYKDRMIIIANGVWLNPLKDFSASPNPFHHKMLPYIKAVNKPIDEKFFYGLSDTFDQKDTSKSANILNSVMLESAIRSASPPTLTSDIEAPDLIFGSNDVIPVGDVNAYKMMEVKEIQSSVFSLKNQMENFITSNIQGGNSTLPSGKQPKSAKEVLQLQQMQQQAMANATLMYYDLLQQEIRMVCKTALQFYGDKQYRSEKGNIVKSLIVPDSPLLNGGVGNMEIRFVRKNSDPLTLYSEMLKKSFESQKVTEIIEAPIDLIRELDFEITDIELVPEKNTEMEKTMFKENIMMPMTPFVQMGLVSPVKMFLRWMEKMGEHPADWVDDKVLPQMLQTWNQGFQFDFKNFAFPGQSTPGAQSGNMQQSNRGVDAGMQGGAGNGGGPGGPKFGQQGQPALKQVMGNQ